MKLDRFSGLGGFQTDGGKTRVPSAGAPAHAPVGDVMWRLTD